MSRFVGYENLLKFESFTHVSSKRVPKKDESCSIKDFLQCQKMLRILCQITNCIGRARKTHWVKEKLGMKIR